MSVSVDKEPAGEADDARSVLASWLDDYAGGRCDRADMQESFLSVCRSNPDAPWDALALLDQYQRRGRIDAALARTLKTDIAQLVFGVANQTDTPRDTTEATLDTTGSRWRKLLAESEEHTREREPPFADPAQFRRDFDPVTRPPPPIAPAAPVVEKRTVEKPLPEKATPAAAAEKPRASRSTQATDILRDRYELIGVLGRGSSGTVYKALDRHRAHLPHASRCVAVKVLKADFKDRPAALAELEREFHQAQSLSHPNVVSVFDLDRDGDTYFIVMEMLEGELLSEILERLDGRPMTRKHALGIIGSVGAALAHAHRRDMVHADLKPRNIMITSGGEVRVLDFGFARNRALELHSASSFQDVSVPAPAYASVERVNGSEPDPSDDVYSLACIAYELLSGQHPFGGRSAVLARAHGRPPRRVPDLSRKQQQALNHALLWTRGERRIDVVELLAALGCSNAASQLVPPQSIRAGHVGGTWGRRAAGALALLLLVGVGFGAVMYLEQQRDASKEASPAVVEAPPAAALQGSQTPNSPAVETSPAPPPAKQEQRAQVEPSRKIASAPASAEKPAPAKPQSSSSGAPASVQFEKDTYVATESDGSVHIVVERSGSAAQAATFRWILRSNSAEPGTDYAGIGPGTEDIAAGTRSASITVPLVSDALVENTEVFLIEIEPAQSGLQLGERSHAAVIVVDDD
jgi:serine/threonine protein kinase